MRFSPTAATSLLKKSSLDIVQRRAAQSEEARVIMSWSGKYLRPSVISVPCVLFLSTREQSSRSSRLVGGSSCSKLMRGYS